MKSIARVFLGSSIKSYVKLLILISVLSACAPQDILLDPDFNPPVYFGSHTIQKGETLYSIAWRYGRDYKDLAWQNGISPPYKINTGNSLSLEVNKPPQKLTSRPSVTKKKPKITKLNSAKRSNEGTIKTHSATGRTQLNWLWPHNGPVIAAYSVVGTVNKGIDIKGKIGDPILAAADGDVVYAGSGLLGYGKLIILLHQSDYLTAYAHNSKLLVVEGQSVKGGERIAELGSSGTSSAKLHFEVRVGGRSENPLKYLPARKH